LSYNKLIIESRIRQLQIECIFLSIDPRVMDWDYQSVITEREFEQYWSTIPLIPTKRTIFSLLNLSWTQKWSRHMMLKDQILAWDRQKMRRS